MHACMGPAYMHAVVHMHLVTNSFWLKNAGLRLNFLSLAQNLSLEIPSLAREKQAQKFEPGIPGSKIEPGMQPFGQAQNLS